MRNLVVQSFWIGLLRFDKYSRGRAAWHHRGIVLAPLHTMYRRDFHAHGHYSGGRLCAI